MGHSEKKIFNKHFQGANSEVNSLSIFQGKHPEFRRMAEFRKKKPSECYGPRFSSSNLSNSAGADWSFHGMSGNCRAVSRSSGAFCHDSNFLGVTLFVEIPFLAACILKESGGKPGLETQRF